MGNSVGCLVHRWGPQLSKLISLQNIKGFLQQRATQVKEKVHQHADKINQNFQRSLRYEINNSRQTFDSTKQKIGQKKLKKIARSQHRTVDEIVGVEQVNTRFSDLKKNFHQQFQSQIDFIMKDIRSKRQAMEKKVEKEKPTVHLYHRLRTDERRKVEKEVWDKYGEEMREIQRKWIEEIQAEFDFEEYKNLLDSIDPTDKLKDIRNSASYLSKSAKHSARGYSCLP